MNESEFSYLIPINLFDTCLISNTKKESIIELYPTRKNGAYYLDKFNNFLKDNYNLSIKDYCIKYLNITWPKCPIKNEDVGFRVTGKGLVLSRLRPGCVNKESSIKFKEACEKMSDERLGENNPMFGKKPWNKNKDKRNPIIKKIAEKNLGRKVSTETRLRQSQAAKNRKFHGHTGKRHSAKTKRALREATSLRWSTGSFNKVTSIHLKMRDFLSSLNLKESFCEEFQVKYFSMDFAFPCAKVAIECQGSFFHVDPRIYPNGPINDIQRRNYGRDKAKKSYCSKLGWRIIEVWEPEINDGSFKEFLKCELLKLNLLNQSVDKTHSI